MLINTAAYVIQKNVKLYINKQKLIHDIEIMLINAAASVIQKNYILYKFNKLRININHRQYMTGNNQHISNINQLLSNFIF